MIRLCGLAGDEVSAEEQARTALTSGAALDRFRAMVGAQSGDSTIVDDPARLGLARDHHVVAAPCDGILQSLDAELVGRAAVALGAGRARVEDAVDPGVGVVVHRQAGDTVRGHDPILTLYHRNERGLADARALASQAVVIGDRPVSIPPLILSEVR
jgi:thymidine phosphorylase